MITDQLVSYIKNELNRGVARDDIIRSLTAQSQAGWQKEDIEEALSNIEQERGTQINPDPNTSTQEPLGTPSSNKSMFTVIGILFGIFFVGGGAFAMWYFVAQEKHDPEKIIYQAMTNMLDIKSNSFSGDFSMSVRLSEGAGLGLSQAAGVIAPQLAQMFETIPIQNDSQQISFLLTYNGVVDVHDPQKPMFEFNGNLAFSAPGYGNMSAKIEIRGVEQKFYARLSNLPFLGVDTSSFANKWIEIDLDALIDLVAQFDPQEAARIKEELDVFLNPEENRLSPEIYAKITHLAQDMDIIIIKDVLEEENIGDKSAYHYSLGINWLDILDFYKQALDIMLTDPALAPYAQDQIEQLGELDSMLEELEFTLGQEFGTQLINFLDKNLEFELWIDKQKILPRQVHYRLSAEIEEVLSLFNANFFGIGGRITTSMRATYDNFDEPTVVEVPKQSTPISQLLGNALGEARVSARNAQRVSDIKQLQLANEFYFDDHGMYPASLQELAPKIIPEIPTDPLPDQKYLYSTNSKRTRYHLGASLETSGDTGPNLYDSDFSSSDVGWTGGFSGRDTSSCNDVYIGYSCYDVTE